MYNVNHRNPTMVRVNIIVRVRTGVRIMVKVSKREF